MSTVQHPTVSDVLLDRANSSHSVTFVNGQDEREQLGYGELLHNALLRLAQLQSHGFVPGTQLIIQTGDSRQFLEGFWACLLGGITAVPISGGNSSEHRHKLFRIAELLDNPGLYTDSRTRTRLADFAASHGLSEQFRVLNERIIDCDTPVSTDVTGSVHPAEENETAFIQFSSGSTSTPKGVVLTHANLMTNHRAIVSGCQMSEHDYMLSWMPLTHDMGLIGFHLTPVLHDISHSLMPTDLFVRRPALWLTESARAGATILCSPNFGYQHVLKSFKPEKHEGLNLSAVRLLFNGAEPISVSLCERFMAAMAPFKLHSDAMYPVYGLAEASLAATFPDLDERFNTLTIARGRQGVGEKIVIINEVRNAGKNTGDKATVHTVNRAGSESPLDDAVADSGVTFVAVGLPVQHMAVQITSDTGQRLPEQTTGHICIRGRSVTRGYYREPELNAAIINEEGWLDTGDLGFFHERQLFITGRAKDIIFVSGQNVYPHDLEEIVLQAGLVERGKLAISSQRLDDAEEEQLLAFVLHRSEPEALADTARSITRLLGESAGVRVHAVVPVNRIPKTTSGKVQRYLLVESLRSGEYSALLQADSNEQAGDVDVDHAVEPTADTNSRSAGEQGTQERLLTICNAQVTDMNVAADDNLFELGISSLTLAQIHAAIEESWPDQVDITDLFDYPTVSELANFLDQRAAAESSG